MIARLCERKSALHLRLRGSLALEKHAHSEPAQPELSELTVSDSSSAYCVEISQTSRKYVPVD
jgi:hypothetical protein